MTENFDANQHIFRSPKFQSVVNEAINFFAETPVHVLPSVRSFVGSGVYGLYYVGEYQPYRKIVSLNQDACVQPIYVGKAVPPGWRTGRVRYSSTRALFQRLAQHTKSLQQVVNLQVNDFRYRFMILSDIESDLVVPIEAELIRRYKPLWNTVVDGFGNHDPGAGRYKQACSSWDVLHPGRSWVTRLTGAAPQLEDVIARIEQFSQQLPFP